MKEIYTAIQERKDRYNFSEHVKGKIIFDPRDLTKKHKNHSGWKKHVIAFIDEPDFCDYYGWFLKKKFNIFLVKPIRGVHYTIINNRVSDNKKYEHSKRLYNGKIVDITYDLDVRSDGKHWWFPAESEEGVMLRHSCGLGKMFWGAHITIGRAEGRAHEVAHSEYIYRQILKFNL